MKEGKEWNVLFNDALNTFYLRLYGVRHMVKDHSDSERGNPLPTHGLIFPISSKGSFICTIPQTDSTYHGLCCTSRGALAGTRNSSMGTPWRIDPPIHRTMSERSYHRATSRSWFLKWSFDLKYKNKCMLPNVSLQKVMKTEYNAGLSKNGVPRALDPGKLTSIQLHLSCSLFQYDR